jgi:HAD superfamily hydrolase (TIGR01549 family)
MIKAVIFDYGGTLVRSARPWTEMKPRAQLSAYRYLKRHGLEAPYEEYLRVNDRVFGRYAELEAARQRDISDRLKYLDLVAELFPGMTKKAGTTLAVGAKDAFWRVANGNFKLRRGARACLDELESMGIKLGMVSNHHDSPSLIRSLCRYGIQPRFRPIVVSEAVKVRKPNPAIFKLCLSAMKVGPGQSVYVGDTTEYDVAGAKATGMSSVLLGAPNPDGPKPDFAVEKLSAIPAIVAGLNGDG